MSPEGDGRLALVGDLLRVLRVLPSIELQRRRLGLHGVVALARARGMQRGLRSTEGRARLQRVISAVDRRLPDRGNCVRRALLEMALDRGAARERLHAGLRTGGGPRSGHAWLEPEAPAGAPATKSPYDAVIVI
jgi:hypothetical protein